MTAPPMPRLSESLPFARSIDTCQACGLMAVLGVDALAVWQEADEQDRFEDRHLVLCRRCSDRLIEPHPRLYRRLPRFAPEPGRMDPCLGCRFARALRCESPMLKANGGAGLPVRFPQPMYAFVDGTRGGRRTGWQETIYPGPATCEGRAS